MRTGWKYALLLAGGYLIVGVTYIVLSGMVVASVSLTAQEAARLDTIKGTVYMVVTALLLGVSAGILFARAERRNRRLLAQQQALIMNERRITAGVLAASRSHDANNILMALMGELDGLRFLPPGADPGPIVQRMEQSLMRLAHLHQTLRNAGRQTLKDAPRDCELADLVAATLEELSVHPRVRSTQVRCVSPLPLPLRVDPLLFHQALTNLVLNAAEATSGSGRVEIRLRGDQDRVEVDVDDNGPGIPPERRADLFEALRTTKPDGSGLGLFSVRACVDAMGGTVELAASGLGGACFHVVLPRVPPTRPA